MKMLIRHYILMNAFNVADNYKCYLIKETIEGNKTLRFFIVMFNISSTKVSTISPQISYLLMDPITVLAREATYS